MHNKYVTIQGDTFCKIALKTMGSEAYTGALIEANPSQVGTVIFPANITLVIPDIPEPEPSDNLPPWRR